ncbi:hypothetical protein FA95DRAFT_1496875 [Auriscalpium vulgare]|uniref:Uncharacterized protein n=1 Tax=Auriscalpium vulgare TaxID=40419 RepID=A0ACB8RM29_9AGAM|nr:hypothetical protein FA95DRAFT_1496875 [Auriscalpium vulgare]
MTRSRPAAPHTPKKHAKVERTAVIAGRELPISPVLDTFFLWTAERHSIHQKRVAGESWPWTEDPIFQQHAFTNVFRIFDRTTQYILRHVVHEGDPDLHETCFRVILFRFFCRISTWELLVARLGTPTWRNFDLDAYEAVLRVEYDSQRPLYGTAYIMPAPPLGGATNFANHLRLLKLMMDVDLPGQLAGLSEMSDAFERIALFPSMGDFLAFQLLLDLNMIPQISYPEDWAICGPGADACLRKIFGPGVVGHFGEALKWLHDTQQRHFARLGIAPERRPRVHCSAPPGLSLVDLEHSLCETDVYSRVKHPDIPGLRRVHISGRRNFKPGAAPLTCDLPRNWKVAAEAVRARARKHKPLPPVDAADPDPEWVLSHIVKEAVGARGVPLYLVRYKGYTPEDDLWQDEEDLEGAVELLEEWRSLKESISSGIASSKANKLSSNKRRASTKLSGRLV